MRNQQENGFVILFAAIVSAFIILVMSSMFSISRGLGAVSSVALESMYSFYAADTAIECALLDEFRDNSDGDHFSNGIDCTFKTIPLIDNGVSTGGDFYLSGFIDDVKNSCAQIVVDRNVCQDFNGQYNLSTTVLYSRGFNFCKNSGGEAIPNEDFGALFERRFKVVYLDSGTC